MAEGNGKFSLRPVVGDPVGLSIRSIRYHPRNLHAHQNVNHFKSNGNVAIHSPNVKLSRQDVLSKVVCCVHFSRPVECGHWYSDTFSRYQNEDT
jgi:hypothetical protein